jgi:hypothetical protein
VPKHDLSHLLRKGRTWFVVQDVPRDLRAVMGKRRLSRSLHTHDVHVAMAERYAVLADFAAEFKAARKPGEADAVQREAMAWRGTTRRLDAAGAWNEEEAQRADPVKLAAALQFHGIARGIATPLLLHVDRWLAEGNRRAFRPSTIRGHRIAAGDRAICVDRCATVGPVQNRWAITAIA